MKTLIIVILIFTFAATGVNSQNCDNFNVANTTTVAGWTEQVGDWAINNSALSVSAPSSWNFITYDGSTQADGCITARLQYGSTSGTQFMGLTGRYVSPTSNIMVKVQDNGSSGYFDSYFFYCDDISIATTQGLNFGTDLNMQVQYSGTTVTLRIDIDRNGTWDSTYTTTVTNTGAGLCGVSCYEKGTADDFCYAASCCTLPAAAGTINGSPTVCEGELGTSYSVPVITDATSYQWSYSGTGASINGSTESITIDFAMSATDGSLTVFGQNSCGDGAVSASFPITIDPLPADAGTISGNDSICLNESGVAYSVPAINDATSYFWNYSGTGVTINGTGNSVTLDLDWSSTDGDLTVRGVNSCDSGLVSPAFHITTYLCEGIDENTVNYPVSIVPNPATDMISIEFPGIENKDCILSIVNSIGQTVFVSETFKLQTTNKVFINLETQPAGNYVVRIVGSDFTAQKKLIISR
ncbi:MAG: hypothetical protein CVU11_07510 [Bacteroidetes bacterium HGW-Bacteroidetes-6]|jgi:hypothetical protein|nr:MAG: hypothetical protein CVU11_07510 [Bacteroidetes bacterium HGW-Bacteroidetes-6]